MGQKVNPNIFRLGVNKTWNTSFCEKKTSDLALYTFKNVELESYIQKFLIDHNLILHEYKIHFSQSCLNIYISYFIPTTFKTKKNIQQFSLTNKKFNEDFLLNKFIKGFNIFNKTNYKIVITLNCINKKITFLSYKQLNFVKKKLLLLRRYKTDTFNFDETFNLLLNAIINKNSSFMVGTFIANKLKIIKKHNRFLKCIKHILSLLIKSDFSMIKSIKIKISGKINRARRTKNKIITIGDIPAQTISEKLNYSQTSKTHNPNGSLGVKIWITEK